MCGTPYWQTIHPSHKPVEDVLGASVLGILSCGTATECQSCSSCRTAVALLGVPWPVHVTCTGWPS